MVCFLAIRNAPSGDGAAHESFDCRRRLRRDWRRRGVGDGRDRLARDDRENPPDNRPVLASPERVPGCRPRLLSDGGSLAADGGGPVSEPLVGRDAELRLLETFLDRATSDG